MTEQRPPRRISCVLLQVLMFMSGLVALIYEIVWSKRLALLFGADIRTVSISAAIFMGGLAAGSYYFGRLSDRSRSLLKLYAALELGIALCAFTFEPILTHLSPFYFSALTFFPDSPLWHIIVQFSLATLLLFPATLCMGGTLPVICRFFATSGFSHWLARLYGWNTAGAALGCIGAAFIVLPQLGLVRGEQLAVVTNLLIAGVAFLLSYRHHSYPGQNRPAINTSDHRSTLSLVALVGGTSMALEILWTRVFVLFFGATIYSFALILGSFLLALAIGSYLYTLMPRRITISPGWMISIPAVMGGFVLLLAPFYDTLAVIVLRLHQIAGANWWLLSALSFCLVFATLLLPVMCAGAMLPTASVQLSPAAETTGHTVGRLLLYNTVGAMAGSMLCALVLIPHLGLLSSFRLLGILLLFGAGGYACVQRKLRFHKGILTATTVGVTFLVILQFSRSWDQKVMNSGVYIYAPRILASGGLKNYLGKTRLLYSREGIEANVAVTTDRSGNRALHINGKADANSTSDMPTQVLLGQLPMLLHPQASQVLVIGLGSGVSAGAAASHSVEKLVVSELSPAVVEAAGLFSIENRGVLNDPRIRLSVSDGRSLLAGHDNRFDVIISEPSNPWQSGNANLFTAEFYRLAASRLTSGGLICQWLPTYDLKLADLRSAVATFLDTFHYAQAFYAAGDLILVGSQERVSLERLQGRTHFPSEMSKQSLLSIGIDSPHFLLAKHYLFDQRGLANFSADAPLNTDRHPLLEFSARHLKYLSNSSADIGQSTLLELRRISDQIHSD